MIEKRCLQCGTKFLYYEKDTNRKFCSHECHQFYLKEPRDSKCSKCGNKMTQFDLRKKRTCFGCKVIQRNSYAERKRKEKQSLTS